MKIAYGKHKWDNGWQFNILPSIIFMKSYRGYTLVFEWALWYFEIYTDEQV